MRCGESFLNTLRSWLIALLRLCGHVPWRAASILLHGRISCFLILPLRLAAELRNLISAQF